MGTTTSAKLGDRATGDPTSVPAAKHTPGPWRAVELPHYYGRIQEIVAENLRTVAQCELRPAGKREETAANARLIAAAPELLFALEQATKILCHLDEAIPAIAIEEAINDAREAIAKATGDQS